jgi:GrpB-like predicted nucleotidyltransferase (UPF0157 family)
MSQTPTEALRRFAVVAYDPRWPDIYRNERDRLLTVAGSRIVELEHIGSTAIPNLRSKPIVDMMAAAVSLRDGAGLATILGPLDYRVVVTDMHDRLFLRKQALDTGQLFHLHIVEAASWDNRNERIMRDFLLDNPEEVLAYGALKDRLALQFADDSLAYTKAKTPFIQQIVDLARDRQGLPRVNVWTA